MLSIYALAIGGGGLHLVVSLCVIVVAARLLGRFAAAVGQPPVVGEMLAGILLGPSLLGHLAPDSWAWLFGPELRPALTAIASGAIAVFMFAVGLELDRTAFAAAPRSIVIVTTTGVAVPFVAGCLIALPLYPWLAGSGARLLPFALFLGLAMAVTAFPVLARILRDRRLERTPLGVQALAVAAANDAIAWVLLAAVVAVAQTRTAEVLTVMAKGALLVGLAWTLARPALARLWAALPHTTGLSVAMVVTLAWVGAWLGDAAGVHAVFGAFLAGVVAPRDTALELPVRRHVLPIIGWLLPLYFALTGMRTDVGLLSGWREWAVCGLIVVVASASKSVGTAVGAILAGAPARVAMILAVLMNTRGLMELVVLNVGLEIHVISPTLFAMMVVMTLVTTVATGPLLFHANRTHPDGP